MTFLRPIRSEYMADRAMAAPNTSAASMPMPRTNGRECPRVAVA